MFRYGVLQIRNHRVRYFCTCSVPLIFLFNALLVTLTIQAFQLASSCFLHSESV